MVNLIDLVPEIISQNGILQFQATFDSSPGPDSGLVLKYRFNCYVFFGVVGVKC